ncbi:MAG TPA: replicative DNA helicase, partial [bacterium]|nr:replicative DNA helicase [bacterium]
DVTGGKIQNNYVPVKDLVEQKISKMMQNTEGTEFVSTGYKDLDDIISGGFRPGQLVIIAARPSMGKSALALNMAKNAALLHDKKVMVFSLEMGKEEVLNRFMASEARINVSNINSGKIDESEWAKFTNAGEKLSESFIFVDDTSGLTPGEIRSKCRRIKSREGLDLILIDYLQLMRTGSSSKSQNREQEVSEISRTLKSIAKELGVPVVALSQLNREVDKRASENKRPQLSNLRESGAIEQDADIIIFIYREDYYDKDSSWKGVSDIIVAKNRNGRTDSVKLSWLSQYTSFENYAGQQPYGLDGYDV